MSDDRTEFRAVQEKMPLVHSLNEVLLHISRSMIAIDYTGSTAMNDELYERFCLWRAAKHEWEMLAALPSSGSFDTPRMVELADQQDRLLHLILETDVKSRLGIAALLYLFCDADGVQVLADFGGSGINGSVQGAILAKLCEAAIGPDGLLTNGELASA